MKKIFPLWISEEKLNRIKENAKKENRSTSSYVLTAVDVIESMPNIISKNWYDNEDEIKKKLVKRMLKK